MFALVSAQPLPEYLSLSMLAVPPTPAAAADDVGKQPKKKEEKLPMQQRVLNGILNVSNVPYRCVAVCLQQGAGHSLSSSQCAATA